MNGVVTLDDRKRARADELRAGFESLCQDLANYGRAHGGRFWIYGSAIRNELRHDSDIDILVDFIAPATSAALDFVERRCDRLRLKADVQPRSWCKQEFIDKISGVARVLP